MQYLNIPQKSYNNNKKLGIKIKCNYFSTNNYQGRLRLEKSRRLLCWSTGTINMAHSLLYNTSNIIKPDFEKFDCQKSKMYNLCHKDKGPYYYYHKNYALFSPIARVSTKLKFSFRSFTIWHVLLKGLHRPLEVSEILQ